MTPLQQTMHANSDKTYKDQSKNQSMTPPQQTMHTNSDKPEKDQFYYTCQSCDGRIIDAEAYMLYIRAVRKSRKKSD
ncbi:uncharacterized protein [Euphorbia lathyris]|uniref:uncharacterized protein isoform X2 n=1 Tax=Euphorbia lathyris TaxID=212925 RepID=UPI003313FC88